MNKEIIKAMQGEKKVNKVRAWWRVVLFPVWGLVKIEDKIVHYLNNRQAWSEERANEILNYYIPRRSEWDEKEQCFYFFDNGMGWNYYCAKSYLKRKDRRFWKVNSAFSGGKMREYLIEKFQLEGFTKEVRNAIDSGDNWTEITFKLN